MRFVPLNIGGNFSAPQLKTLRVTFVALANLPIFRNLGNSAMNVLVGVSERFVRPIDLVDEPSSLA